MGVLLGLSLGVHQGLPAQVRGQRVRITSVRYQLHGQPATILSTTPDRITVRMLKPGAADTLALSLAAIDRLEISRFAGHRTGLGALIGLGVGAAAGLAIASADYRDCTPKSSWGCVWYPSKGQSELMGAVVFGALGAGVGALVGSSVRNEEWEAINVHPLSARRFGLGLAISF